MHMYKAHTIVVRFPVGSPRDQDIPRLFAMRPFICNTLGIPNVPFVVLYLRFNPRHWPDLLFLGPNLVGAWADAT